MPSPTSDNGSGRRLPWLLLGAALLAAVVLVAVVIGIDPRAETSDDDEAVDSSIDDPDPTEAPAGSVTTGTVTTGGEVADPSAAGDDTTQPEASPTVDDPEQDPAGASPDEPDDGSARVLDCSANVGFAPVDTAGLPGPVATTVLAIDQAAATCDWAALEQLTIDTVHVGVPTDDLVEYWRQAEANGVSDLLQVREVLRSPPGTAADGTWRWPSVAGVACEDYTDADWDWVNRWAGTDRGPDDCPTPSGLGFYGGWRLVVTADGTWIEWSQGE